jgi:hypothetical protein
MVDPEESDRLRDDWDAANEAAFQTLMRDLIRATTAEEVYVAHARYVRTTAADFSRQMEQLSQLLRRLAGEP